MKLSSSDAIARLLLLSHPHALAPVDQALVRATRVREVRHAAVNKPLPQLTLAHLGEHERAGIGLVLGHGDVARVVQLAEAAHVTAVVEQLAGLNQHATPAKVTVRHVRPQRIECFSASHAFYSTGVKST
jgi:hypothetical protein